MPNYVTIYLQQQCGSRIVHSVDSSALSATIVPAPKYLSFAAVVKEETYEEEVVGLIFTLTI